MFPMSIVLVQKSANGTLGLIHDKKRLFVSKLRTESYEAPPQINAKRRVVKFAFDGAQRTTGLRVHSPRSARHTFRSRQDDDIGFVNPAGFSLKINAEMNFESGLTVKLENCMRVRSRMTPNASGSRAERCNARERAVHVLIADDRLFATRRLDEEYHALSARQLNFALRPNKLTGRDLVWLFQDDWRNQPNSHPIRPAQNYQRNPLVSLSRNPSANRVPGGWHANSIPAQVVV